MEYVWKDSVRDTITYRNGGGREVAATRAAYPNRYLHRCDAWAKGLLVLNRPGRVDYLPFEKLRAEASEIKKVAKVQVDGRELCIVQLRFNETKETLGSWEVEVCFDPKVNYLVSRVSYTLLSTKFRRIASVREYTNCGSGIYFPSHISGETFADGHKEDGSSETYISDVTVNRPIPSDVFRLRFPNGVYVTDSIRGTYYRVHTDGSPFTGEKLLGSDLPPSATERAVDQQTKETTEEPGSATRWLLPISFGLVVLGVILAIRQRRRMNS